MLGMIEVATMTRGLLLGSVVSSLLGCYDTPIGSQDPGWLRAQLTGAVEEDFAGTGTFWSGADPTAANGRHFSLQSLDELGNDILFYRAGHSNIAAGSYDLSLLTVREGGLLEGFTASVTRKLGSTYEAYIARSGELQINTVASHRVTGSFTFSAVLYCRSQQNEADDFYCVSPNSPDPNAPVLNVSGTFEAVKEFLPPAYPQ